MRVQEIKKKVKRSYREQLKKRRRPEQVEKLMQANNLDFYAEKCARNLIRWNLHYRVKDFIDSQFFSLSYMPYLPNLSHISSDNAYERWLKVKDFYKKVRARESTKKAHKRKSEKKENGYHLSLLNVVKFEEEDKGLKFNTIEGFELCLQTTSLYNPKSGYCEMCRFSIYCVDTLKERNMNLYRARIGLIGEGTYLKRVKDYE